MSIKEIKLGTSAVIARQVVTINQSFVTQANTPFYVNLDSHQVDFIATHVIVRQVLYSNVGLNADSGIFNLWSDLLGKNIISVAAGPFTTISCPETIIPIYTFKKNITFVLDTALVGNFGTGISNAPTGFLSVTLEFVR